LRIDNAMFIICASVQNPGTVPRRCIPINPNRTAMPFPMPPADLPARRLAVAATVAGLSVTAVFIDGAPPGAGVR